jgi:hypothetical protein
MNYLGPESFPRQLVVAVPQLISSCIFYKPPERKGPP